MILQEHDYRVLIGVGSNRDNIDGLVQERRNSIAKALKWHFSCCTNLSIWYSMGQINWKDAMSIAQLTYADIVYSKKNTGNKDKAFKNMKHVVQISFDLYHTCIQMTQMKMKNNDIKEIQPICINNFSKNNLNSQNICRKNLHNNNCWKYAITHWG